MMIYKLSHIITVRMKKTYTETDIYTAIELFQTTETCLAQIEWMKLNVQRSIFDTDSELSVRFSENSFIFMYIILYLILS